MHFSLPFTYQPNMRNRLTLQSASIRYVQVTSNSCIGCCCCCYCCNVWWCRCYRRHGVIYVVIIVVTVVLSIMMLLLTLLLFYLYWCCYWRCCCYIYINDVIDVAVAMPYVAVVFMYLSISCLLLLQWWYFEWNHTSTLTTRFIYNIRLFKIAVNVLSGYWVIHYFRENVHLHECFSVWVGIFITLNKQNYNAKYCCM